MELMDNKKKIFLTANQLLEDAFRLGEKIISSGFRPDLLVALWRGGTPVAIAVEELLTYQGIPHNHQVLKTRHYQGIENRREQIDIDGLETVLCTAQNCRRVLLVDDVFDTGLTVDKVITSLETNLSADLPDIRIAAPYFKPGNNLSKRIPHYYLYQTDQWLVFPHEIVGLSPEEIGQKKLPELDSILKRSKP